MPKLHTLVSDTCSHYAKHILEVPVKYSNANRRLGPEDKHFHLDELIKEPEANSVTTMSCKITHP